MDPTYQSNRPRRAAPDLPARSGALSKHGRLITAAALVVACAAELTTGIRLHQETAQAFAELQSTAADLQKTLEAANPRVTHARTMEVTTPHERVAFCQLPDGAQKASCAELNPLDPVDMRDLTPEATAELKDTVAQLRKRLEANDPKAVRSVIAQATGVYEMVILCQRPETAAKAACATLKVFDQI